MLKTRNLFRSSPQRQASFSTRKLPSSFKSNFQSSQHCFQKSRSVSCFSQKRGYANAQKHDQTLKTRLQTQISDMKKTGTYKAERIIQGDQASQILVGGKKVLNFCANNYLGLSNHPELIKASKGALDSHGYGLSSVRFICGTQDIHKTLEKKISQFHEKDDSILYAACFDANAGIFEALLTQEDAILSDSLNHASIIDGVRLAKSQKYRYNHMDMTDLENKLKEANDKGAQSKVIVTDGVFSMDGGIILFLRHYI